MMSIKKLQDDKLDISIFKDGKNGLKDDIKNDVLHELNMKNICNDKCLELFITKVEEEEQFELLENKVNKLKEQNNFKYDMNVKVKEDNRQNNQEMKENELLDYIKKGEVRKKWDEYESRMKKMEEIIDNIKVGWNENVEKIEKLNRIVENIRKRNMERKINNGDKQINKDNVKKGINEEKEI